MKSSYYKNADFYTGEEKLKLAFFGKNIDFYG
jgi:hypothetical protein